SLLQKLSNKYPIGLLTNIYPIVFEKIYSKRMIPQVKYAAIVQSCDYGIVKPSLEIFKIAQKEAHVEAEEILFIDDSIRHLNAAQSLHWQVKKFNPQDPTTSVNEIARICNLL